MQFEVTWRLGFDFNNPFSFKKLLETHDYVWEGDDEDE